MFVYIKYFALIYQIKMHENLFMHKINIIFLSIYILFHKKKVNRNSRIKHFGNVVHFTRKIFCHDIKINLFHGFSQQIPFTHIDH